MSLFHSLKWVQLFLFLGHDSPILGMLGTKALSQLGFDMGFVARLKVRWDALQNCPPLSCKFFWFLTLKRTYGQSFISFDLNLNWVLLALGLTVLQVSPSCSLCLSGNEGASVSGFLGVGGESEGPQQSWREWVSSHVPGGCTQTPRWSGRAQMHVSGTGQRLLNSYVFCVKSSISYFPFTHCTIFNIEKGELLWKWVGFGAASSCFQLMWARK